MCFFIKLGRHVSHGERMNPIDFEGQRSKVKVTMDIYGDKLVNMIETKPLCISSSNLAEILTVERMDHIDFGCQRSRSQWTRMEIIYEPNKDLNIVRFLFKLGRHVNHGKPY